MWKSTAPARENTRNPGYTKIKRNNPTNGEIKKDFKEKPLTTKEKAVHKR